MNKEKNSYSIGFIGGGRIVSIFLGSWKKESGLPSAIEVSDSN